MLFCLAFKSDFKWENRSYVYENYVLIISLSQSWIVEVAGLVLSYYVIAEEIFFKKDVVFMSGTSYMFHRDCSNFELVHICRNEDENVPNPFLV